MVCGEGSKLAFALTWVCYASFYFTRKPFSVVKSTLGRVDGLSLSTNALGIIDTCFLATYALTQFITGPLGDKIGARTMLGTMLAMSALSTALIGVSSAPLAFALLMAINGAAQSAGYSLCMTALFPFLPNGSGAATLGWWSTCQQIGGILSTTLAAWVLGRYGWRAAFLVPAIGVLCSAVLIGSCLPEKRQGEARRLKKKDAESATVNTGTGCDAVDVRQRFVDVVRIPFLLHLGIAYFWIKLVRYTLLMWLPFYMSSELGYSASDAGYMSTLFDVGATAGAIAGGVFSDGLFDGRRVTASLPAIALATLLVGNFDALAAGGATAIGAAMAVLGFLIAIPDTSLGGVATHDVCERNGNGGVVLTTALSLTNGIGAMGPILQGFLTPILVARFGWSGVFIGMAALCVVSLLVLIPAACDERRAQRAGGRAKE